MRERIGTEELYDAVVGQLEVLPADHRVPAYDGLMGGDGRLWVRDFPGLGSDAESRGERWSVFDSSGAMTAAVRDEIDVERVVKYGLNRAAVTGALPDLLDVETETVRVDVDVRG